MGVHRGFSGEPELRHNKDGRTATLLADFSFTDRMGVVHEAKKDFRFDGLSIPPVFWGLIASPYTVALEAGIIHDAEWRKAYEMDPDEMLAAMHRANRTFSEILVYLADQYHRQDISALKRYLMFTAVQKAAIVKYKERLRS